MRFQTGSTIISTVNLNIQKCITFKRCISRKNVTRPFFLRGSWNFGKQSFWLRESIIHNFNLSWSKNRLSVKKTAQRKVWIFAGNRLFIHAAGIPWNNFCCKQKFYLWIRRFVKVYFVPCCLRLYIPCKSSISLDNTFKATNLTKNSSVNPAARSILNAPLTRRYSIGQWKISSLGR